MESATKDVYKVTGKMTVLATCVYGENLFAKPDSWFGYKRGEKHFITITEMPNFYPKYPFVLEVGNVRRCYPDIESIKEIWKF